MEQRQGPGRKTALHIGADRDFDQTAEAETALARSGLVDRWLGHAAALLRFVSTQSGGRDLAARKVASVTGQSVESIVLNAIGKDIVLGTGYVDNFRKGDVGLPRAKLIS